MIQDIYPYIFHNEYRPNQQANETSQIICMQEEKILVAPSETIVFPRGADFSKEIYMSSTYLFSITDEKEEISFFLLDVLGKDVQFPAGFVWKEVRKLRDELRGDRHLLFAAFTACHLAKWYRSSQYCGCCGHRMEHSKTERAMVCTHCANTVYPKIMPAVIVAVTDKDRILITQYKRGYRHSALIAGFTEIGETLEETVQREVMEEAGLRVKNIRYYKSQPWGIASDLLVGFYCEVDGATEIRMDEGELSCAEWVKREDVQLQPDNKSLTNEMMMNFKFQKSENY